MKKYQIVKDGKVVKESEQISRIYNFIFSPECNKGVLKVWKKRYTGEGTIYVFEVYGTYINGRYVQEDV